MNNEKGLEGIRRMKESLELYDDFSDDRREGTVVGSFSTSGHRRLGIDLEKILSIDNGALRIAPLIEAGFGRAAIAYGPFGKGNGLAFGVNLLNGHNTAQAGSMPDMFRERMSLWLKGSETDPKWERLARWLVSGRVLRTLRQFRWWRRIAKNSHPVLPLNENLAVGWFPQDVVRDPRSEGNSFIMHALGPENGELWAGGNGSRTRALRGVQNLPLYLVAILREGGVVYYGSSLHGTPGMAPHPSFRPMAVEKRNLPEKVYLGIHQGVLGQIGWRLDTRVKEVRVARLAGYETWHGGAKVADRLAAPGVHDGAEAEAGGKWRILRGAGQCGIAGAAGSTTETIAILDPRTVSGLIHAEGTPGNGALTKVGLVWRFLDGSNHWRMELTQGACEVAVVAEGKRQVLSSKKYAKSIATQPHRLDILDDGARLMAYVDGEPVADGWLEDSRLAGATGVGILFDGLEGGDGAIRSFEAHPRKINLPAALAMDAPKYRRGSRLIAGDDFNGTPGDLGGRLTPVGGQRWERLIGKGVIELTGKGAARIRGSVEAPCPGRTAYCLDWPHHDFADLEVTITPPGTGKGQKQRGMAGFILYQDPDNYVTLNVWRTDYYDGASISTFFKYGGFEDIYDAIWSNVGNRIYYGRPATLRLCCDGEVYLVFINDEPVLYRAFRDVYPTFKRLHIRKVGLIGNWEFGSDTGSRFEQFQARF